MTYNKIEDAVCNKRDMELDSALGRMEARNPSLSFKEDIYAKTVEYKKIVSDKVGTDFMTNQPIYKTGAEEWDVMDLYQKYKSMEPDAEERKYESMIKEVVRSQKRR